MALSMPTHLSFSKFLIPPDYSVFLSKFSHLSIRPKPIPRKSTVIRMGGGPRTYPGGVSRWQWKRMQAKKAKQLLKARLSRERQIYEMRKRAELKAAVADLERPWEAVNKAPTLFSVCADEQVKVLADRFQKPGGFDLWTDKDGPQLFKTPDGIPSARFFPKGVVHSVRPYGKVAGLDDSEDGQFGSGSGLEGEDSRDENDKWIDGRGEPEMNRDEGHRRRRRKYGNMKISEDCSGVESENSRYSGANSAVNRNIVGNLKYSRGNSTVNRSSGEMRKNSRYSNAYLGVSGNDVGNLKHSSGNLTVNRNGDEMFNNSRYSGAKSGVSRNVVGNSKYSRGNSAANRNGGETRTNYRGSRRTGNSGERRISTGRSENSSSSSSSRMIQNNDDVGQGLVKSRNSDSENYDAGFQSQIKHRVNSRTIPSRRDDRTSRTWKNNDRSQDRVKSRSSESDVYDMGLQQDGTYGFPNGQS